jgi:hypothetical protein
MLSIKWLECLRQFQIKWKEKVNSFAQFYPFFFFKIPLQVHFDLKLYQKFSQRSYQRVTMFVLHIKLIMFSLEEKENTYYQISVYKDIIVKGRCTETEPF